MVELKTADGLTLPGLLFSPARRSKKAVIYLHGNGTSSVFYSLARLAPQAADLNRAGFAYLTFNNRGAYQYHRLRRSGRKEKIFSGTAFELIRDCIPDIDAAVAFLRARGYTELYLIGFSTGANKICVYNYYRPHNPLAGYLLMCGGDDTAIYYHLLGPAKFRQLLDAAKRKIRQKKGQELVPFAELGRPMSYRAFYDTANPDGDYNTFPYHQAVGGIKLSHKKLFRHFSSIRKPTLVVYGGRDPYMFAPVGKILAVLEDHCSAPEQFTFVSISGADHGFTGHERQLDQVIIDWLKHQSP
ncbi:MAG TPA: alpha/beta fold hydrolase [Patescibacteria group bacterium]|nr:alpha/beta fold hydrolase [Patescibacteria group bacterium]